MRNRIAAVAVALMVAIGCAAAAQQAAAQGQGRAGGAPAAGAQQVHGNLLQMMRGTLFPASNVVFAAQDDPTKVPPADDPSTSPNPLNSAYPGWEAVRNAGIAIAEGANLLTIPGRVCSNGRMAPVNNADWQKYVTGLRAAGMAVYKAGQAQNLDQITDAAGTVAVACGACHDVYREKTPAQGGPANRCIAS
jgi:hypothetical protein